MRSLNWQVGQRRGRDVSGPLCRVLPASQCRGCEHRRGVAGTMWARRRQGCCSGKPAWGGQDAHAVSSGYAWPPRVRVGPQSLAGTQLLACRVVSRCKSVGRSAAYQGWQSRHRLRACGSVTSVKHRAPTLPLGTARLAVLGKVSSDPTQPGRCPNPPAWFLFCTLY
jgi:hypothetical protein